MITNKRDMGKTLSTVLSKNRIILREQMFGSNLKPTEYRPTNTRLTTLIDRILDLIIEQAALDSNDELSHKLLEITLSHNDQICIPGLGPALSALRISSFSLFARELPEGDWSVFYLHLSAAIDGCLLSDNAVARHATSAIETAVRLAEAEAHSRHQASINWINRAIHGSLKLDEIVQTATVELARSLKVSRLALYRASSDKLLILAHEYHQPDVFKAHDLLLSADNPLVKQILKQRHPIAIDNVEVVPANAPFISALQWVKSRAKATACLVHPIFVEDKLWGLFYATHITARKWLTEELSIVAAIADQLTISLNQAELFAQVARENREWTITFDAISDAVFLLDRRKFLRRANNAALDFLNKKPEDVFGIDSADLHTIFRDTQNMLAQVISSGDHNSFEQSYGSPSRVLLLKADPIYTPEGESLGVVCVLRDVTDLRQVEAEANIQRQFFTRVIENAYDAVYMLDENGYITWANARLEALLGYSLKDLEGKDIFSMLLPEDVDMARSHFLNALNGEPQMHELQFKCIDGEDRLAIVTHSPYFSNGEINGVLGIARDVTDERHATEVAAQADKLHALGQMASGVAHDFNNVLATILGRTQLLKRMTEEESLRRGLEIIETAALDGASTARRIQNFARLNATADFKFIDLSNLIRECLEFTSTRWNNDANARGVHFNVTSSLKPDVYTKGEASELREVFVNLIFNAIDAMPQGGSLHLTTATEEDWAIVRVSDNGIGMSEETRRRVFEPFFTTKGSAGTGLGLPVSLSIISHHAGSIEIESTLAQGTSFIVRLPQVQLETEEATPQAPVMEPAPPCNIVIIDDEDSVREVLADMLDIFGHTVVQCASAQEGLAEMEKQQFNVVFTDLAMPDMDGWAVADQVRERWPATKIILMTGYGADTKDINPGKVDAVVSKPFDIEMLRSTLSTLMRPSGNFNETLRQS